MALNKFQDLGVDLAPLVIRAVMEFLVLVWTLLQGNTYLANWRFFCTYPTICLLFGSQVFLGLPYCYFSTRLKNISDFFLYYDGVPTGETRWSWNSIGIFFENSSRFLKEFRWAWLDFILFAEINQILLKIIFSHSLNFYVSS